MLYVWSANRYFKKKANFIVNVAETKKLPVITVEFGKKNSHFIKFGERNIGRLVNIIKGQVVKI